MPSFVIALEWDFHPGDSESGRTAKEKMKGIRWSCKFVEVVKLRHKTFRQVFSVLRVSVVNWFSDQE